MKHEADARSHARPPLSVVIPSYNQARYLPQCLESVLGQSTALDVEVLVLDGGSQDGSREILEKYAPRLAYWRSHKDDGQAAAVAEGFARAKGEILFWINSDDFLLPEAFRSLEVALEEHPRGNFYYGGIVDVDETGQKLREHPTAGVNAWTFRHRGMIAYSMASFYRRDLYVRAGPVNAQFQFAMDLDLFLRMMPHAHCVRMNHPHLVAAFRTHPQSKTSSLDEVRRRESVYVRSQHDSWPGPSLAARARWAVGWAASNAYRSGMLIRHGHGPMVLASLWNELRGHNDLSPFFGKSLSESDAAKR